MTPITKELFDAQRWEIFCGHQDMRIYFENGVLLIVVPAQDGSWDSGWFNLPHITTMEELEQLYKLLGGKR